MSIYDYLHEKCLIYQVVKQQVEERIMKGEEVEPEEWMDGQWYPSREQIDPASGNDGDPAFYPPLSTSLFFPLKGKLNKNS